eukprot:gene4958-8552_t
MKSIKTLLSKTKGKTIICDACKERIYDKEMKEVFDLHYHISCFKCTCCGKELKNDSFILHDNLLHCERDYDRKVKRRSHRKKAIKLELPDSIFDEEKIEFYQKITEKIQEEQDLGIDILGGNFTVSLSMTKEINFIEFKVDSKFGEIMKKIQQKSEVYESLLSWLKPYEIQMKEISGLESKIFQKLPKFENDEFYNSIEKIGSENEKWKFVQNFNNILQETLDVHQNCIEKMNEFDVKYQKYLKNPTFQNSIIENLHFLHDQSFDYAKYCETVEIEDYLLKSLYSIFQCPLDTSIKSLLTEKQIQKLKTYKIPRYIEPKFRNQIFGVELEDIMKRKNEATKFCPTAIQDLIEYLEKFGPEKEGVFRIPGSQEKVFLFKSLIDSGRFNEIEKDPSELHSLGSLLKLFFRELPNPLLTFELYDEFISFPTGNDEETIQYFSQLIPKLPTVRRYTLDRLLSLLFKISLNSSENMMNATNLSTCWAINLLKSEDAERFSLDVSKVIQCVTKLITFYPELKENFFPVNRNPKTKKELQELFHKFSNNEGSINIHQLQNLFIFVGVKADEDDIKAFLRYVSPENIEISYLTDFTKWWEDLPSSKFLACELKLKLLKKSSKLFDTFDVDKSNYLDEKQLKELLNHLFEEDQYSYESCFKEIDDNHDGKITFAQLTSSMFT